MVEKILNNTTPYGKIRASHEGSLHSSTLIFRQLKHFSYLVRKEGFKRFSGRHIGFWITCQAYETYDTIIEFCAPENFSKKMLHDFFVKKG